MIEYKTEGYIVMVGDNFICEANGRNYICLKSEDTLKNENIWRPKFYHNLKAAQTAASYQDNPFHEAKIIKVSLIYKESE